MKELWEYKDGILRVGNTYFGENGVKYGTSDGLEPFLIRPRAYNNDIFFNGDWVVLHGIRRAYHKNGTIVDYADLMVSPSKLPLNLINTNYPLAILGESRGGVKIKYYFYLNKDGSINPLHGDTKVIAENPNVAIENAMMFYKTIGVMPQKSDDDAATIETVDKCVIGVQDEYVVMIDSNNETYRLEASVFNKNAFEDNGEDYKWLGNVYVMYLFGQPMLISLFSDDMCEIFELRRGVYEDEKSFMKKVKYFSKVHLVKGKAPYRAEINRYHYIAWVRIDDEIVEVKLPYGYTLEGVEWARGRVDDELFPLEKVMGDFTVLRVFDDSTALVKSGDEYFLYSPYTRNEYVLHELERDTTIDDKIHSVLKIRCGDRFVITTLHTIAVRVDGATYNFTDTLRNLEKIRKIIKEIDEKFEETVIQINEWGGGIVCPRIVAEDVREVIEKLETTIPVGFWKYDSGQLEYAPDKFLYDAVDVPVDEETKTSKSHYFIKRISEEGVAVLEVAPRILFEV